MFKKQNVGYDIANATPDGGKRYIEAKSIKEDGSFSITNNEYAVVHQYSDKYFMCLLVQNAQSIQAIYIQSPIERISVISEI